MRHAQTLNEAQFRKVLHYCRTRRHANRDTAIFMVSFFAGLRAKEIAALKLGDVFDQLFLDILKNCGFKDASSHSGRRTYITRLANKGVGVRLLAALAGHSHISTTQRYIDVNADQMKEAVELL